MASIRVAVAGASGYAGGELVRWLARHPSVELVHLAAGEAAGRPTDAVWPALRAHLGDRIPERLEAADGRRLGSEADVVFTALPAGAGTHLAAEALEAGARVIDLSGVFRLRDPALHARWYGGTGPTDPWREEAVYGLPELNGSAVREARLVANPGCYPTAVALALAPLLREGLAAGTVVVDAKSGLSGAGRAPSTRTSLVEGVDNVEPYAAGVHRHEPEMEQTLREVGFLPGLHFVPHLVPMARGILATCYLPLSENTSTEELLALYGDAYRDAPFVRVREALPGTRATLGSNHCDVSVRVAAGRGIATAVAALDNLGKGAAGQAVQNMNLMTGRPETEGLWSIPLFP